MFRTTRGEEKLLMAPKNQRWWLTADSVHLEIEADADALYRMVSDPDIATNLVNASRLARKVLLALGECEL